jgi:hypothetical protein
MEGISMVDKEFLKDLYKKNPVSGNYIIEVALERYNDVFNGWDNAPFEKRDINPALQSFLESSASHIPFKYNIDICFCTSNHLLDKEKEKQIVSEIRTHYYFSLEKQRKILKHSYKRTTFYVFASLILLFTAFFMEKYLNDRVVDRIVFEGLNIGGWVFMWEAISFYFFKKSVISNKVKECKRFINASIYFKNCSNSERKHNQVR